jgi:hypothetical protein
LVLGHRPDRAVVLGVTDLLAGVDALLRNPSSLLVAFRFCRAIIAPAFVLMLFSGIATIPIQGFRRHFDCREHFARGNRQQRSGQNCPVGRNCQHEIATLYFDLPNLIPAIFAEHGDFWANSAGQIQASRTIVHEP